MVFVPWGEHGICKFWMLKPERCYNRETCRFRHPAEADRSRLWDEHLAAQAAKPRPPPPASTFKRPVDRERQTDLFERIKRPRRLSPRRYSRDLQGEGRHVRPLSPTARPVTARGERHMLQHMVQPQNRVQSEYSHSPPPTRAYGDTCPGAAQVVDSYEPDDSDGRDDFRPAERYQLSTYHEQRPRDRPHIGKYTDHDKYHTPSERSQPSGRVDWPVPDTLMPNRSPSPEYQDRRMAMCWREEYTTRITMEPKNANHQALGKRNRLHGSVESGVRPAAANMSPDTMCRPPLRREAAISEQMAKDFVTSDTQGWSTADVGVMRSEVDAEAEVRPESLGKKVRLSKMPPIPTSYYGILSQPSADDMGATKRLSNGEAKVIGPHASTIRVAAPYISDAALEKNLQPWTLDGHEKSLVEAREESIRLQGVAWLDGTRRALQLPVRTFTTACVYYHKFRLAHARVDYNWPDAAAASLLTSCKVEDTLKKSKDVLAAAYNAKASGLEQLGSDDPVFEAPSRVVIGLERLVLEAGGFDFRSRYPHKMLVKLARKLAVSPEGTQVAKSAFTVLTDLHRTFAPLKQTSATLALASLELAAHLAVTDSADGQSEIRSEVQAMDTHKWSTTRQEVMETLLDALDLYTHHTAATILGTKYTLDDFLRIRLVLNRECTASELPRHTTASEPSLDRPSVINATLRVANGHPTPVSPPQADPQARPVNASGARSSPEVPGTLRFMLDPQLAADEQTEVQRYFVEEWEEYDEEIEIPIPRSRQTSREQERERPRDLMDRRAVGVTDDRRGPALAPPRAERQRDRAIDRDRLRDREQDRQYHNRRHDERDRRFDDRRDRHFDDRRYEDDDRRRRDDRR